jgi:hypothetical protein
MRSARVVSGTIHRMSAPNHMWTYDLVLDDWTIGHLIDVSVKLLQSNSHASTASDIIISAEAKDHADCSAFRAFRCSLTEFNM